MPRRQQEEFLFAGFSCPHYTQIPDEFFDYLAPRLTEAELRVCLYIMRRTFGFKKSADTISFSQMVSGIKRRDTGEIVDEGTGMSRSAVWRGVNGLLKKEVIQVEKRRNNRGDSDSNLYTLKFLEGGSSPKDTPRFSKRTRVYLEKNSQHDSKQQIDLQHHHAATAADQTSDDAAKSLKNKPRTAKPSTQTTDRPRSQRATKKEETETLQSSAAGPGPAGGEHPLVPRLITAGVTPRIAKQLVRNYPAEWIDQALTYLPYRQAQNPAGYLVREIEDGGWLPPATYAEREKQAVATAKRRAAADERKQVEAERTQAEQEQSRRVQGIIESLTPQIAAELLNEARAQIARHNPKLAADPQSPFVRGALFNLVEERFLSPPEREPQQ